MLSNHHDRDADECGADDLDDDEDYLVGGDDDGVNVNVDVDDDGDGDGDDDGDDVDVDLHQVEPDPSSGDDHVQQAIQRLASRSQLLASCSSLSSSPSLLSYVCHMSQ